jgi:hypothetical protein
MIWFAPRFRFIYESQSMKRLTYMLVLAGAALMLCRDAAMLAGRTNPEPGAGGQYFVATR